ncbi:MAG TPA: YceI family protein [Pirellulales bacterium]|jgi:polyisoprenoid-binding protein YceI
MKFCIAGLGLFTLVALAAGVARADTYTIDPVHSIAIYRAGHMGVSHSWGRFDEMSGHIALDEKIPEDNMFDLTINAGSINSNAAKRDEHLKSPDFLNAKQFPTITFKSTKVKPLDDKTFEVTGTLTLHGVSKPLTIKVERVGGGKGPMGGMVVGVDTSFQIKRSDFDMKNMLEVIPDDVLLFVSIEAGHK